MIRECLPFHIIALLPLHSYSWKFPSKAKSGSRTQDEVYNMKEVSAVFRGINCSNNKDAQGLPQPKAETRKKEELGESFVKWVKLSRNSLDLNKKRNALATVQHIKQ